MTTWLLELLAWYSYLSFVLVIRSPSGDTDVLVLAVNLLNNKEKLLMDNRCSIKRTLLWLWKLEIREYTCRSSIGLHAFPGNDCVPLFFRKSEDCCWKFVEKCDTFEKSFMNPGSTTSFLDNLFKTRKVCMLSPWSEEKLG